ncbi:MAG TPA: SUMF1/EgtB/PvdO family nonheme iron enzyme [Planctomycetota bacterium]
MTIVLAVLLAQEVVDIPAGEGTRAFAIGAKEVAWADFDRYRKEPFDGVVRPALPDFLPTQAGILPAELDAPTASATYLRWHAAVEYAAWLSKKSGAYWRLPTEAEWKRAGARAKDLQGYEGGMWEYALESEAPGTYDPVVLNGAARQRIPKEWFEADPQRPMSLWYLIGSPAAAGLRPVKVEGPESREARDAAAAKIEVRFLKAGEPRQRGRFTPIDVEIRNAGDRALDEVEVLLYALTPDGKPHLVNKEGDSCIGQPCFTRVWPVLATSRAEDRRSPLKPGEARRFAAEVPTSYDDDAIVNPKAWGGRAVTVRFAP